MKEGEIWQKSASCLSRRKDVYQSFSIKGVLSGRINAGVGGLRMCNSFCPGRRNEMLNVSLLSGCAHHGTFPLVSQSTGETLVKSH